MKIVCFGDSNTWGYDPRDFFGRPYDSIWTCLLEKMSGCSVINWGENGREIPTDQVLFPEEMDLLILMLGTNDLLGCRAATTVCERMAHFLRKLAVPAEKILLVAPPHLRYGEWVPDSELINASVSMTEQFRSLALKQGIWFADAEDWGVSIAYDGVHFSEEGHYAFAEGIFKFLTEELGICW